MLVLCIGDIQGKPGREVFLREIAGIKRELGIDAVILNAENAAGGFGITSRIGETLLAGGADVLTMGNHVWAQREVYGYFDEQDRIIRPANMPGSNPGRGKVVIKVGSSRLGVINLIGNVFMKPFDDPFQVIDGLVEEMKDDVDAIIVDFHAEATSEKIAMGHFLDGRVAAVVGTHTHVQTADEKILSAGTAFISDLGMVGAVDSVLGVRKELVLEQFLTRMPMKWQISDNGPFEMCGAVLDINEKSGLSRSIERFRRVYPE